MKKSKNEKFDPKTLKAFDKVLVINNAIWHCAIFSHIRNAKSRHIYVCHGMYFKCCIPYNEETKHLVGTGDKAPEYYRYWET